MRTLLDGLLMYSRLSARQPHFEPVDIGRVLDQAIADLGMAMEACGGMVMRKELPMIKANEQQLVQLFRALLDNAIKYRRDGAPVVDISAEPSGDDWIFAVRDNGIGIDPQYFDQIFIIFKRLHGRGQYSGSGIGLAVCKRIVESHRGRIWVCSEPGKGSTFYFALPVTQPASSLPPAETPVESPKPSVG
jgi:light-regulated signal transduction histidine kinase (bacteriophytochrome)